MTASTYKVLTFDGGGVRGVLTAKILDLLVAKVPDLCDKVNLFAGTSTGSFVASGLAVGLEPKDLVELYQKFGAKIFGGGSSVSDSLPSPETQLEQLEALAADGSIPEDIWKWLQRILDDIKDLGLDLENLVVARYGNAELKKALETVIAPGLQMGQLKPRTPGGPVPRLAIASFDLDNMQPPPAGPSWEPRVFNSFPGSPFLSLPVLDACLRSSAAPTYFPTFQNYTDGGVFANNPSVAALSLAVNPAAGRQSLDNVRLLSLGTGAQPQAIPPGSSGGAHDWGIIRWGFYLIDILTGGVQQENSRTTGTLLTQDRYQRVQIPLGKAVALDDAAAIPFLISLAENYARTPAFTHLVDWVKTKFLA